MSAAWKLWTNSRASAALARQRCAAGLAVEEFLKRPIRCSVRVEPAHYSPELRPVILVVHRLQRAAIGSPSFAVDVGDDELRASDDLHDLGRGAVQKLRAELDRQRCARIANGVNASADAVARLKYDGGRARFGEPAGRREPGHSGSDDDDVYVLRHVGR